MLSDIEIADAAVLRPIREVAAETLGIEEQHLVPYGHHKAKVDLGYLAGLSADAVPALQDLPDDLRGCALADLGARAAESRTVWEWNLGARHLDAAAAAAAGESRGCASYVVVDAGP